MYSFRGCIEQIFFDKKLPIKKGCVFGKPILYFRLFSGQSTYFTTLLATIRPLNSVSVFVIVKVAFIHSLNGTIFILPGELAVIHCLSNSFISRYCNYFLEYSQASILLTVLCIFLLFKFAAIQSGKRTSFQRISEHQSQ